MSLSQGLNKSTDQEVVCIACITNWAKSGLTFLEAESFLLWKLECKDISDEQFCELLAYITNEVKLAE
jgi:hypothetical protein